jgi:hypothetical protein
MINVLVRAGKAFFLFPLCVDLAQLFPPAGEVGLELLDHHVGRW